MEVSGQLYAWGKSALILTGQEVGWAPRAGLDVVAKKINPNTAPVRNWTLVVQPVA